MRFMKLAAVAILLLATSIFAQRTFFVSTTENNVGVYANATRQMNERALVNLNRGALVRVIDENRTHYRVRTEAGVEGWVEKRVTMRSEQRSHVFDEVEISGYLDNPTPIFITDLDGGAGMSLELERSFADALRRNTDIEQINRALR